MAHVGTGREEFCNRTALESLLFFADICFQWHYICQILILSLHGALIKKLSWRGCHEKTERLGNPFMI